MGHRGAPLERTVGKYFERLGYRFKRSYASAGIYDLLCFKSVSVTQAGDYKVKTLTEVLEVQVKGTPYEFKEADKLALKEHAELIGAKAVYAYRRKKKGQKRGKIMVEYL